MYAIHVQHTQRPPQTSLAYLDLAATLDGAPLACCFEIFGAWPDAALAALFAFSAFFLLSAVAFFSFPSLMAACLAAARASGRMDRRSLMTSRDAPTMARWCLTVRRVLFFATSCGFGQQRHFTHDCLFAQAVVPNLAQSTVVIPQKYPFCAVVGTEQSRLFFEDSFAEEREIRFCHSGIGRSCCHHERRACPVCRPHRQQYILRVLRVAIIFSTPPPFCFARIVLY